MKGFVLTMDATLAVVVAIVLSAIAVTLYNTSSLPSAESSQLFAVGNDMLTVLFKSVKLQAYVGQNPTAVNPQLGQYLQLLPAQYCGNVTVTTYSYSGGSFTLRDNFNNITAGCPKTRDLFKSKRVFAEFGKQRFGLAEMEVWLR